jgi:uncharacterized protein
MVCRRMGDQPALPLPMFPLGTVLFPHMPLPLHVFEDRYKALVHDTLGAGREFGVVLIERGHEVGGGDMRFGVGTVARIVAEAELPGGRWALLGRGERRIRVDSWLPEDPYPRALVATVAEDPGQAVAEVDRLARAEREVRRSLALAAELGVAGVAPATVDLDPDPAVAAWQLCAVAPLGPVDRQQLLEVEGTGERLELLAGMAAEAATLFAHRLSGR